MTILSLLFGCKKEGGKLLCNMTYTVLNKKNMVYSTKSNTDIMSDRYSQFGDYITSITPSSFIGKFLGLHLFSWYEGNIEFSIDIITNSAYLDIASPKRLADFSNNSTVNFTPEDIVNYYRKDIEMIYFVATSLFYYQEFKLPVQYGNIYHLSYLDWGGGGLRSFDGDFIGGERTGCDYKGSNEPLMAPIFNPDWTADNGHFPEMPKTYVFGNTASTFLFYSPGNGELTERTVNDPGGHGGYIIRSEKFTPITLNEIPAGETRTINATMTFNTTDLIQIYKGKDSQEYTSDDIFVYAPNFWERMSVSIDTY